MRPVTHVQLIGYSPGQEDREEEVPDDDRADREDRLVEVDRLGHADRSRPGSQPVVSSGNIRTSPVTVMTTVPQISAQYSAFCV